VDSTRESEKAGVIIKCSGCGKTYKVHTDRLPQGVSTFPCRKCGSLLPIDGIDASDQPGEVAVEGALTVLVAVNEDELAALVQRILQRHAYRVLVVSTGEQTLKTVQLESVDLLLINIYLPDMMGFEVLERMGEMEGSQRIPVILLSSVHHAAKYKRAPTSLYGADDYLERHHLPDLLIPKIRFWNLKSRKELVLNINNALQTETMINTCKVANRSWIVAIIAVVIAGVAAIIAYIKPKLMFQILMM